MRSRRNKVVQKSPFDVTIPCWHCSIDSLWLLFNLLSTLMIVSMFLQAARSVSGTEWRGGSKVAPGARCCHLEEAESVPLEEPHVGSKQSSAHCSHNPKSQWTVGGLCTSSLGGLQHQLHLLLSGATFRFRCWSDPRFPTKRQERFFKGRTSLPPRLCSSQHFQFNVFQSRLVEILR